MSEQAPSTSKREPRHVGLILTLIVMVGGLAILAAVGLAALQNRLSTEANARDHLVNVWNVRVMQTTHGSVRILDKYDNQAWTGYDYNSMTRTIKVTAKVGSCITYAEIRGATAKPASTQGTQLLLSAPSEARDLTQWIDVDAPNFRQMVGASSLGKCVAGNTSFWGTTGP